MPRVRVASMSRAGTVPAAVGGRNREERAAAAVEVRPVSSKRELRAFIDVPYAVYADDPAWVPPLRTEQRHQFSPKSAFFQHARVQLFVAYRDGKPVGRISAQIDDLRMEHYADATGHFGVLEAIDDPAVFAALLGAAEEWLRAQGMTRVIGPFNLSINGDIGVMIEGFEKPPVFLTGHGRRYYDARVQELGYHKAKDVVAYTLDPTKDRPRTMVESARRAREQARVRIRPLDKSRMAEETATISAVFNDAWANNWSFVPFTQAEFAELAGALKYLVPKDLVQFAEVDGETAAMLVIVPNLNELIGDLRGNLLPLGWAKLLWRLKFQRPKSARVALMGVCQKFHTSSLAMALVFGLIEAVRESNAHEGMEFLEMGWVLEDNFPLLRVMRLLGGKQYKSYRVYEKSLP
jgi:hypothetical protein